MSMRISMGKHCWLIRGLLVQHQLLLFISCLALFILSSSSSVSGAVNNNNKNKNGSSPRRQLFVFGDSYVDTGNVRKSIASSWKLPYGLTFPGRPSGRFSDGLVLTDYLARFMGVKSPIPYRWRKIAGPSLLRHGMNFAYGGTGVFDTLTPQPNMTTQIDFLDQLLKENKMYYSSLWNHLRNSVALVSVSGNDYNTFISTTGGSLQDLPGFISRVVNQTVKNVARLQSLGIKKVVVTGLPPLGCLPEVTIANKYRYCNQSYNLLVTLHNLNLQQAIHRDLNNNTNNSSSSSLAMMLDVYNGFMAGLGHNSNTNANNKDKPRILINLLQPCCRGMDKSKNETCGSVDPITGEKRYTVCKHPSATSFFWDSFHPTHAAWRTIAFSLRSTFLTHLF